ncbi:MAG: hypothetical protein HC793_03150 [Aquincola sp.]|nr:hypothetical protein [Aquincola sp.]
MQHLSIRRLRAAVAALWLSCLAPTHAQPGGMPEADPDLFRKLAAGQTQGLDFSEAGRRDMLAVVKVFIDEGCTYRAQRDDPPGAADFASLMGHLMPTTGEGVLLIPLLAAHPAYLRTATFVGLQGCDAPGSQTILRTLIRALRTAPPPVAAAPTPPRQRYDKAPPSSANHVLHAERVNPWWKATGAFNPGGRFEQLLGETRVLSCDYRSPTAPHPEGRYAWFDAPPTALAELRRLGRGHPVADIGPLRFDRCPKSLAEFDQAKQTATRASP